MLKGVEGCLFRAFRVVNVCLGCCGLGETARARAPRTSSERGAGSDRRAAVRPSTRSCSRHLRAGLLISVMLAHQVEETCVAAC